LFLQGCEKTHVSILLVELQRLAIALVLSDEARQRAMGELWRIGTKAQLLQIKRVQCLLEVSLHRDREHRLVEVDRLAHQGKTSTCDHRNRGPQILNESSLVERPISEVSLDDVLG